ncbi:hypothetical protein LCGC14_1649730 [marine sediment metagenome]|uniref:Uncharacterized protein n=1 Tax=marine sediment metagenome TaxID=412755 RepID=A0A0F9HX76_9ZZZZ
MDFSRASAALRCAVIICGIILASNAYAQSYKPGVYVVFRGDTIRMGQFFVDQDTIQFTLPGGIIIRIIDSMLAANVVAVDTNQFVSMNRDDAIRGEKSFLGVVGFRSFGQFNLTSGQMRSWWVSHDTATKRLGDTVLTASSIGTGEQTMQLYSSGIFDLPKQSAVRAFRSSNVAHAIVDTVVFNGETFDNQDEFDIAAGEFIARAAGTYFVSVQVASTLASSVSSMEIRIRKNYANYSISGDSPLVNSITNFTYAQYTDVVKLAAGGSIKIHISSSHTGTVQGDGAGELTWINIIKIL